MHEVHASELFKALQQLDGVPWPLQAQPLALERAAMLLWMAEPGVWANEALQVRVVGCCKGAAGEGNNAVHHHNRVYSR